MWKMPKMQRECEDSFDSCWSCGTGRDGAPPVEPFPEPGSIPSGASPATSRREQERQGVPSFTLHGCLPRCSHHYHSWRDSEGHRFCYCRRYRFDWFRRGFSVHAVCYQRHHTGAIVATPIYVLAFSLPHRDRFSRQHLTLPLTVHSYSPKMRCGRLCRWIDCDFTRVCRLNALQRTAAPPLSLHDAGRPQERLCEQKVDSCGGQFCGYSAAALVFLFALAVFVGPTLTSTSR